MNPTTRPKPNAIRRARRALLLLALLLATGQAFAQGFSALVSPPRFEDAVKPGAVYRNVVEITNVSGQKARFNVQTADWALNAEGSAVFTDALAPNSCRPWVGIEAREVVIAPNAKRRYRFEVRVPANAPSGQCRFALMIEGDPQRVGGDVSLPVSGRIGVIVYLTIGDAAPQLAVAGSRVQAVDGRDVPVLRVRNAGNAHGRLEGFIDGRDAKGRRFTFLPSNLPILPGETRDIALAPQGENEKTPAPAIAYPLTLKGRLEYGAQRLPVEAKIAK